MTPALLKYGTKKSDQLGERKIFVGGYHVATRRETRHPVSAGMITIGTERGAAVDWRAEGLSALHGQAVTVGSTAIYGNGEIRQPDYRHLRGLKPAAWNVKNAVTRDIENYAAKIGKPIRIEG